ncbi:MAG TPA: thiamine phosphate synthase [Longimicrobiaceae bacterium]
MAEARARPFPPLHVVTDDEVLARPGFARRASAVLEAGGVRLALHLRGPSTGGRALFEEASGLAPAAHGCGAVLLVNDRVDVALAAGADGVQLGRRGMLPADARRLVGAERLLGCSVSPGDELPEEADFLLVGSVYATASHPGRAGSGAERLAETAGCGVPLVGIGGITPERVAEVRGAGAAGVAALRGVWDAPDPAEAVARYLEAWKDTR